MKLTTKKITTIGMLSGLAMVKNLLMRSPIVPSVAFLSYDPKDIIIVIGGFIYGPGTALIMSCITSVLELMIRGGTIWDVIMNIVSTCSFAMMAAFIYEKNHTKKGAIIGLLAGIVMNGACMVLWNYIVDPIYYQMARSGVVAMLPAILLFNVIKCGLNAGITMLLYKPIVGVLRNSNMVEKSQGNVSTTHEMLWLGAFIALSMVLLILGMKGII